MKLIIKFKGNRKLYRDVKSVEIIEDIVIISDKPDVEKRLIPLSGINQIEVDGDVVYKAIPSNKEVVLSTVWNPSGFMDAYWDVVHQWKKEKNKVQDMIVAIDYGTPSADHTLASFLIPTSWDIQKIKRFERTMKNFEKIDKEILYYRESLAKIVNIHDLHLNKGPFKVVLIPEEKQ